MAPTGGGQNSSSGPQETPAWQVAASNSTLNTWFGNRRQPSWMTNAAPVKPTPRPPQPPKQQSQLQQPTQATTPPISTTAIQQQQQQQQQQQPNSKRLPQYQQQHQHQSQSQSQSQPGQPQQQQPPQRSNPSIIPNQPRLLSPQSQQQPQITQTSIGNLAPEAVLPSPAPSDEPSPSIPNSYESPQTANSALPPSPAEVQITDKRYFVFDAQLSDSQPADQRQATNPTSTLKRSTTAHSNSNQSNEVPATSGDQSPPVMVLNTPPTPSAPAFRAVVPQDASQNPTAKRRRAEKPLQIELIRSLRASEILPNFKLIYQAEAGSGIEQARHQLLRDACDQGDLFFIVLHQLFCTWSVAADQVRQICENARRDISLVETAFGTMGTILKNNSTLKPQSLKWLAAFPGELAVLRHNPVYAHWLVMVLDFLLRIAYEWMVVTQEHQLRGYPLCMDEMVTRFHLFSPVLQLTIFRASWRNLGIRDGQIGQKMELIFIEDQRFYLSGSSSNCSRNPAFRATLVARFQAIVSEAKRRDAQGLQQTSPPLPSPRLQNSPQLQTIGHIPTRVTTPLAMTSSPAPPAIMSPMLPQHPTGNYPGNFSARDHFRHSSNHEPLQHAPVTTPWSYGSPYSPPELVQFGNSNINMLPGPQQVHQQHRQQQHYQASMVPNPTPQHAQQLFQNLQGQQLQYQVNNQQTFQSRSTERRSSQPRAVSRSYSSTMSPQNIPQNLAVMQHRTGNASPPVGHFGRNVHQMPQPGIIPSQVRPSSLRPQQAFARDRERLIPPPNMRISMQDYPHDPQQKSVALNTLHQSHLRSPRRILRQDMPKSTERYYQAVKGFLLEPTPLDRCLHKFTFDIPEMVRASICRKELLPGSEILPMTQFTNGSLLVRIRCCHLKNPTMPISETGWLTTDTSWPEHISVELNGNCTSMGIRRKAHYSKDLPIEASTLVVAGDNFMKVAILSGNTVYHNRHPFIAVELVEISSHSAIMRMVNEKGMIPADGTRDIIKRRLAGSLDNDDDDDLAMVVSDLSINLADPFTFSIFTIPVRGKACTHLECFDLETWLNTRLGKKTICICGSGETDCKRCKEPSFVDKWRCPLCDGDARPYSLRIDGFLIEVREKLQKENKLRTKSIFVSADGSWKPKEQAGDGDSDVDSDDGGSAAPVTSNRSSARPTQPPPVEVIELDDD